MSKIFDFIDLVTDFIDAAITFIKQLWHIVSSIPPIVSSVFSTAPPVLYIFFTLFLMIATILFIWRLIP